MSAVGPCNVTKSIPSACLNAADAVTNVYLRGWTDTRWQSELVCAVWMRPAVIRPAPYITGKAPEDRRRLITNHLEMYLLLS